MAEQLESGDFFIALAVMHGANFTHMTESYAPTWLLGRWCVWADNEAGIPWDHSAADDDKSEAARKYCERHGLLTGVTQ